MNVWDIKTAGAAYAHDRRKVRKFYDPVEKKWYLDITDFWNETFYKDFETDPGLDALIPLMKKKK